MAETVKAQKCPYCMETLKPGAIVCRHCDSEVGAAMEPHGGTCPWCRESIDKDALKCKHCRKVVSATPVPVGTTEDLDCGCEGVKEVGATAVGTIARAQSGCGPCQISDFRLAQSRYLMGYKTCFLLVPIRVGPNGVTTYKRFEWVQRCRAYDLETNSQL